VAPFPIPLFSLPLLPRLKDGKHPPLFLRIKCGRFPLSLLCHRFSPLLLIGLTVQRGSETGTTTSLFFSRWVVFLASFFPPLFLAVGPFPGDYWLVSLGCLSVGWDKIASLCQFAPSPGSEFSVTPCSLPPFALPPNQAHSPSVAVFLGGFPDSVRNTRYLLLRWPTIFSSV